MKFKKIHLISVVYLLATSVVYAKTFSRNGNTYNINKRGSTYKGTVTYKDGSKYEGTLDKNYKWLKKGTYTNKFGIRFESPNWKGESANKLLIFDGEDIIYRGSLKNSKIDNPNGEFVFFDGQRDKGNFTTTYKNIHEFFLDIPTHKPGIGYHGFLNKGKPHGLGTTITSNKKIYSGEYKDGIEDGYGTLLNKNVGLMYMGNFKQGLKHGKINIYDVRSPKGKSLDEVAIYHANKKHGISISYSDDKILNITNYDNGKSIEGIDFEFYDYSGTYRNVIWSISNFPPSQFLYSPKTLNPNEKTILVSKDKKYLIKNAIVKKHSRAGASHPFYISEGEVINISGSRGFYGKFKNGDLEGQRITSKGDILYKGKWNKMGNRRDQGLCRFKGELEHCEHYNGKRVDEVYKARKNPNKVSTNKNSKHNICQQLWNTLESQQRRATRNSGVYCEDELDETYENLEKFSKDMSCESCGRSNIKYSLRNLENCTRDIDSPSNSYYFTINKLKHNKCDGINNAQLIAQSIDGVNKELKKSAKSVKRQYNTLQSQFNEIDTEKANIRAEKERQGRVAVYNKLNRMEKSLRESNNRMFKNTMNMINSLKQKNASIKRSNLKIVQRYKVNNNKRKINPYHGKKVPKVDAYAKIKATCKKMKSRWDNNKKMCIVNGDLYPKPKQYVQANKFKSQAIKVDFPPPRVHNLFSDNPVKNIQSDYTHKHKAASKEIEMGPIQYETIALCWTNKDETRWFCDGPVQKTAIGEKTLESALKATGCNDWSNTRNRPYPGKPQGKIYFCGRGEQEGDRKILNIYKLSKNVQILRHEYQCKNNHLGHCLKLKN
jgi:putative methionine-R-sulfoxide reductase with GAF domain